MKPLKKILFPTDYSPVSANAFNYVLQFAKKINAKVVALHVLWPVADALDYPSMVTQATRLELEIAQKLMKTFIATGVEEVFGSKSKVKVESEVVIGSAEREILQFLEEEEVDLVVMGGKKSDKTPLISILGGVATNVVKNSPCPILVIPDNVPYKNIENLVYASNLIDADPYEIWQASEYLSAYKPYLHYVHFSPDEEKFDGDLEKLEKMKAFFVGHKLDEQILFQQLIGKNIESSLMEYLENYGGDLLVMLRTHESFLQKMFNKSATQNMIRRANIPVLIMTKKDQ